MVRVDSGSSSLLRLFAVASMMVMTVPVWAAAADSEALPEGFIEFLGLMVEQGDELVDPWSLGAEVLVPLDAGLPEPTQGEADVTTEVRND